MFGVRSNVTDLLGKKPFRQSSLFQSNSKFRKVYSFYRTLKRMSAAGKNRLDNKARGISKYDLVCSTVCDIN